MLAMILCWYYRNRSSVNTSLFSTDFYWGLGSNAARRVGPKVGIGHKIENTRVHGKSGKIVSEFGSEANEENGTLHSLTGL